MLLNYGTSLYILTETFFSKTKVLMEQEGFGCNVSIKVC